MNITTRHTILLILLLSIISCSNSKKNTFYLGADLSYISQIEDNGGIYKLHNKATDPYALFSQNGTNLIRLRIWNNPKWVADLYEGNTPLYSAFEDVKRSIRRAKEQNMAVNLDFHYSDIWADPEHQNPPETWKEITTIHTLCDSVYNYTFSVLKKLAQEKLLPEMVQIGNETNCGLMHTNTLDSFPNLSVCDGNWKNAGLVLNAGIKAVKDIDSIYRHNTQIILHVADPKNLNWWFENMTTKGNVTDFDIIGFSYYPLWHTTITFDELPSLISDLKAKFKKEIMIVETAYPFTTEENDSYPNIFNTQKPLDNYPYSPEGQRQFLIDLTQNVINAGGNGIIYWEPAWISSTLRDLWNTGSGWENCAFFDFTGNATNAFDFYNYNYKTTK